MVSTCACTTDPVMSSDAEKSSDQQLVPNEQSETVIISLALDVGTGPASNGGIPPGHGRSLIHTLNTDHCASALLGDLDAHCILDAVTCRQAGSRQQ